MDNLITKEQFDIELNELSKSLPLIPKLLESLPFDQWSKHLKEDAYKRLGVKPVVMYERII